MGIVLVIISCLLLAAHAVRGGDWGLAVFMAGVAGLTLPRERWAGNVAAIMLALGAGVWLEKGADLIEMRVFLGGDWLRLALIMSGLLGLTLLASAYVFSESGRRNFNRNKDSGWFKASLFLLTALLLEITRSKVPFPILMADRFFPGWGRAEIFILALYASWIGGKMYTPTGARATRPYIWALFSLVFFMQLGLGLAGVEQFLMTGKLHLPVPALIAAGPVFRGSGLFMPILFTVSVLLVGPAWCSHLCYIGAWDDLSSRAAQRKVPARLPSQLIWVRLILFVLVVGFAFAMRKAGVPGITAVWWAGSFGLAGLFIMLYFSRKMGVMVHCTSFCPMGIVSNLLGRLSPWRMKISEDCCKCMKCSRFCRYGALSIKDIKAGKPGISCTLCGDCISSCSSASIGYRLPFLSSNLSRKIFLVLIISLHALFMGVARI